MAAHLGSKYRRKTLLLVSGLSLALVCAIRVIATLSTSKHSDTITGIIGAALTSISDNLIASLLGTIVVFILAAYLWPESDHSHELTRREIRPTLLEGIESTTKFYKFRGRTASFFCAKVLPRLYELSKEKQKTIAASVQLLDPDNKSVCEIYSKHRRNIGRAKHDEGVRFIQTKIVSNIVAIYGNMSRSGKVNVELWLSSAFSTFRLDISDTAIVITREAADQPGLKISPDTPSHDLYMEDYILSELQSRRLPDLRNIDLTAMTPSQIPAFLIQIGVATEFNLAECSAILSEARDPKDPYG